MTETIEVTTQEVAEFLQIHDFTVGKLYSPAFAGYRTGSSAANKLYNLEWIAELIGEESGHKVEVRDLYQLVTQPDAVRMLAEHGVKRCASSFAHWRKHDVGPRAIKVGAHTRYVRSDLIEWAGLLAERDQSQTKHSQLPCPPVEIAQHILDTSGIQIDPEHVPDLITRREAIQELHELGRGRSKGTWIRWAEMGIGPPAYRAGRSVYYLRHHVHEWAEQIPESKEARERRRGLPRHKAQPKSLANGPNTPFFPSA